ncbi:ATP-dependent DNA helicase DinG [Actinobaculum suis]|uniref:DNA 5'-3' helicase n=1 Tax=Actinobaculum suis TaxID=1657 RepID=A0A1G6ZDH5_9ACTO|nr:ATP-dependent DNA helicase [Actinobaculum suis]MDY5153897.1 ATP-dependent DNA helicase [Actinobaculum suis]SDE00591.1 ATP-dependent DNA helicase DinG [Actinobaculum suis]
MHEEEQNPASSTEESTNTASGQYLQSSNEEYAQSGGGEYIQSNTTETLNVSAASCAQILQEAVSELGGQSRPGQEEMVAAVARTLEEDGHLLVQAGTGTGKSLGYLVPVMEWAARTGKRAIISTATLALQRQIVRHDAPLAASATQKILGKKPSFALLKGWNNYVCLRKVAGGYPEDDSLLSRAEGTYGASALGEEVLRIRDWANETETGDRDDLIPGASDRAWRQVSVSKRECLGSRCPLYESCFAFQARETAAGADIVVTNHSMLGVQSQGTPVLPEADAYVVDEAHELTSRVTSQLTVGISAMQLRSLARLLRRENVLPGKLEDAAGGLEDVLTDIPDGRLAGLPPHLQDSLVLVLRELQNAQEDIADLPGKDPNDAAAKSVLRARVAEIVDVVEQLLSERVGNGLVPWIARDMEARPTLYVAPLDVSGALANELFEDTPVILTSATLQIGGRFEHAAREVGFLYPSQGPWEGIDVGSPFDPARQAILYVASHLPAPGRDGYGNENLEELVRLIEASQGGALCLFTSRRGAENAAEFARERLETPVLLQGEESLPALISAFAADDAASLFGTLSLWQGVDVPGHTCRLVIIDRIPFPRPNDALVQARTQEAEKAGRSGFMEVSVAQAALLLAQGAGRLLRKSDDRGVVAVLDSRLTTKRYGSFLMASMPRMWTTTNPETVQGALQRLAAAGGNTGTGAA